MNRKKEIVLIGPGSNDPAESVSVVNRAFAEDLAGRYVVIQPSSNRRLGTRHLSQLNLLNAFYLVTHFVGWFVSLVRSRPALAHYAISSGWAMEKGLFFMMLARRAGAKTLGHFHSGGFIKFWNRLPPWRRNFALRQLQALDGLVLASEWWRKSIAENIDLATDKLFVVNNPIDKSFEAAALKMPIERNTDVVLSIGVMGREKGVFDLLAAVQMVRRQADLRLQVAGPEREPGVHAHVRQYLLDHQLVDTVVLQNQVSFEAKLELFKIASVFVLPSYFENFPLVVLEAAAAGLALIVSPVGAIPEFFEDGISAIFVEPGNVEQIAEAVIRLLQNPGERVRLAKAARQVFTSRLVREKIMADMDRVYQTILSRPRV